jgi:putative thioredoxin
MKKNSYIQEANPENFNSMVLENSERGPVMVYYWSPRAGPCMKLMPRLIRLADEYCGKFLLVLLDTDEYGRLAKDEYGVTSVPTVKFFQQGKVVQTIHGAESDAEFRRNIDKLVPRTMHLAQAKAAQAYHQEGDLEQACTLLSRAWLDEPENAQLGLDLAKLLILKGDYNRAESTLLALPTEAREVTETANLMVHVSFLRVAQSAPEMEVLENDVLLAPDKIIARYQLSAIKLMQSDYAGAMDQLLEIVRRDRAFREDAGRKGLIAIFNMLGAENEMVATYRNMLTEALA